MNKSEAYKNLEGTKWWRLLKVIYVVVTIAWFVFMVAAAHDAAEVTRYEKEFDLLYTDIDQIAFLGIATIWIMVSLAISFALFKLLRRLTIYVIYGSHKMEPSPSSS